MSRPSAALLDRIADKIIWADCWEWIGAKNRGGYGVVRTDSGQAGIAHRAIWKALVGPLEDGIDLDHLCRNRACVNPDHLEPVQRQTNVDRGSQAAGLPRATHCIRGHQFTPDNTVTRGRRGRTCRKCRNETSRRYRARLKEVA